MPLCPGKPEPLIKAETLLCSGFADFYRDLVSLRKAMPGLQHVLEILEDLPKRRPLGARVFGASRVYALRVGF